MEFINDQISGLAELYAVDRIIQEIEDGIEMTVEAFSVSYDQDEREYLGNRITVLHAVLENFRERRKDLNYIWN
jgi:hypothetical protein